MTSPHPTAPPRSVCSTHCWHNFGCGGGSINSNGASHSWGQHRCCHCGKIERYEHRTEAREPIIHGPYAENRHV